MLTKKVAQFRFYADNSEKNYPNRTAPEMEKPNVSKELYINGSIFEGYTPIVQLGIQALPGTIFYLNDINNTASFPITIGNTGIYELNLNGDIVIEKITFDSASMAQINKNIYSYLIVDIVYGGKDE